LHMKTQPQNDFFGLVGLGQVVFWLCCLLVKLLFGFSRPVVIELSFGRVVAHSSTTTRVALFCEVIRTVLHNVRSFCVTYHIMYHMGTSKIECESITVDCVLHGHA
jgi:hypothetical protein